MADIKFVVQVDSATGKAQIEQLDKALEGLGKTAREGGSAAQESGEKHGGLWKQMALGQAAYDLARKAAGALKDLLKDSTAAAIGQEQADRSLSAALELTGRTVSGNLKHYMEFASAQQKVTKYQDDEIERAQALMIQLTHLDQNGMDRAMKGAMGLASVMGSDLQSATMMVTKAMEGNYTALGRVGIKIAENLSPHEKQAALLDQLDTLYGRATSEIETFGGRMEQVKKNIDETKEALGTILLKGLDPFVTLVGKASQAILDLIDAQKYAAEVTKTDEERTIAFSTRLREAALAAGMTSTQFGTLAFQARKYSDEQYKNIDAATRHSKTFAELTKLLDDAGAAYTVNGVKLKALLMETERGPEILKKFREAAREVPPPINEIGKGADTARGPLADLKKELGLTFTADVAARIKAIEAALKMYKGALAPDSEKKLRDELLQLTNQLSRIKPIWTQTRAAFKTIDDVGDDVSDANERWKRWLQTITKTEGTVEPETQAVNESLARICSNLDRVQAASSKAAAKSAEDWKQSAMATVTVFNDLKSEISGIFSALSALSEARYAADVQKLDEREAREKAAIENSLMSEDQKSAALAALDDKYKALKLAKEREAFKKKQNADIVEALMNVAVGVTKAIAQGGILGVVMGAIVALQGAIQIAAIKAQPIPMATGGIVYRPTISPGGAALYGEAGAEAIIPISERAKRRAQAAIDGESNAGARPIYHNHIYLDGKEIGGFIIDTVQDAGERGALKTRVWRSH